MFLFSGVMQFAAAIADDIDHVAIKPDNAPYFTPLSRTANSSLPVGVGFHVNYLFFISLSIR